MLRLPPPITFNDGQRWLFGIAMMASGLFVGAVALGLVIFWAYLSFRFPDERHTILLILAGGFGAYLVMQSLVMISMAVGGPVGRVKVSANKDGASFEAEGDDDSGAPLVVSATATVEAKDADLG